MKAVWAGLFAALCLAASAPSMAQSGEEVDRWRIYPREWSSSSADTILALSDAANRRDEINLAAAEGDAAAHTLMCMGYAEGTWGYVDLIGAFNHCAAAAHAGFPRGMRNYGRALELGYRGFAEKSVAKSWYCAAAEAGNVLAFADCGRAYRDGWDGSVDSQTAVTWLAKGALAGEPYAMALYGYALDSGSGIAKDECAAADWYLKAARGGSTLGMLNYGAMNESGICMKIDRANARAWYEEAKKNGDLEADQYIRNLDAGSYGYSGGYSGSPVCTRVMVECGENEWGPRFCEQEVCN